MNAEKLTQKSLEAIRDGQGIAAEYGNQQLEEEHILLALLRQNDGLIPSLLSGMGKAPSSLTELVTGVVSRFPKVSGTTADKLYLSSVLDAALREAET